MKDQFVTYEIAKELKELGFNELCFTYYDYDNLLYPLFEEVKQFSGVECSAPLWQQAICWLKERGCDIEYYCDKELTSIEIIKAIETLKSKK